MAVNEEINRQMLAARAEAETMVAGHNQATSAAGAHWAQHRALQAAAGAEYAEEDRRHAARLQQIAASYAPLLAEAARQAEQATWRAGLEQVDRQAEDARRAQVDRQAAQLAAQRASVAAIEAEAASRGMA
jgi:hypothetical protein